MSAPGASLAVEERIRLSPLALAVKRAPNLDFGDCEPEKKKELGLRALAFMDKPERDAIVLQAGLLMTSWKLGDFQISDRQELLDDIALIKEVWLDHKPTKFRALQPVVKRFVKQAEKLSVAWYEQEHCEHNTILLNQIVQTSASTSMPVYNRYVNDARNSTVWYVNAQTANVNTSNSWVNQVITEYQGDTWVAIQPVINFIPTTAFSTSTYSTGAIMEYNFFAGKDTLWNETTAIARAHRQRFQGPAKSLRKVIRRQMDLLGSILDDPDDVHVFLKGETLTVQSEKTGLKYRFKRTTGLTVGGLTHGNHGSTPYALEIFSEDDVYLSSMCVYLKETPALDQLAAMVMYIKAGEETTLIEKANFFSVGDHDRLNRELKRIGMLKQSLWGGRGSRSRTFQPVMDIQPARAVPERTKEDELQAIAALYPEVQQVREMVSDYYLLEAFNVH